MSFQRLDGLDTCVELPESFGASCECGKKDEVLVMRPQSRNTDTPHSPIWWGNDDCRWFRAIRKRRMRTVVYFSLYYGILLDYGQ